MSLFVKIWTDIEYDDWFLGLSCLWRGAWLQLIVLAKNRGNSGEISFRSYQSAGNCMGVDRGTCTKILRKFHSDGKIKLEELENNVIRVTLPKYIYYQEVKGNEDSPPPMRKNREKPLENQTIEEKSREDKIGKKQPRVFDAAVVDLAEHFRFRIEDNGLEKRCPTLKTEKWLTATCSEIDKMVRLDKRTHEQIKIIIDYIHDDNRPNESNGFCWARNVLTGDKLRKHYQTIVNRIRDKHEGERWSPFEPLFCDNA